MNQGSTGRPKIKRGVESLGWFVRQEKQTMASDKYTADAKVQLVADGCGGMDSKELASLKLSHDQLVAK